MNHAALPGRLRKVFGGTFCKPKASVRNDQPHALQSARLEMLEESLILFRPFANAQNLSITLAVHRNGDQK
jgi:hypothetical protein